MSKAETIAERPARQEITTYLLPDVALTDMPHVPIIWGAFDFGVFQENRERLLQLGQSVALSPAQREALAMLSDERMALVAPALSGYSRWSEVRTGVAGMLGISNVTERIPPDEYPQSLLPRFRRARGSLIAMGTQHSLQSPIHRTLRELTEVPEMQVAEFVLDKHIDTVVNEGTTMITSANVYRYLHAGGYIAAPVFLGPDTALLDAFQNRGEHKKIGRMVATDIASHDEIHDEQAVGEIIAGLQRWGITHATFSIDLDVVAVEDGVHAVRYSALMPYLALGCQQLPDHVSPDDIRALSVLRYPSKALQYFMQREHLFAAQDPRYVKNTLKRAASASTIGAPAFPFPLLETDLGTGTGLRLERALRLIRMIKQYLPQYGIADGIPLKSGATYRGSVVEMCGYEDQRHRTSNAALQFRKLLAM